MGGCLSPLIARPVNNTGVEYKGFAPCKRSVDVTLHSAITDVWNFGRAKSGSLVSPGTGVWNTVGQIEVPSPYGGRLIPSHASFRDNAQVRNEIAIGFWDVFDRLNFETPIPPEGGFPSGIDEG